MKRIINWVLSLTLIFSATLLSSCSSDDGPSTYEKNRNDMHDHIKKDLTVLSETLNFDAMNMSAEVTKQFIQLTGKSRHLMDDLKAAMILATVQNVTQNTHIHGMRVILDEKGNYDISPAEGLVFIFPATIEGRGTDLYKMTLKNSKNWNEASGAFTMTMSALYNDKEVVLNKAELNITKENEYAMGIAGLMLGAFKMNSKLQYFPIAGESEDVASSINIGMKRDENGSLSLGITYSQKEQTIMNTGFIFPLAQDFPLTDIDTTIENSEFITAYATILNDIHIGGTINRGKEFLPVWKELLANASLPADQYNELVKKLDEQLEMYIVCGRRGNMVEMKLTGDQDAEGNHLMPTFDFDNSSHFTALKDILDATTMETLKNTYKYTALPVTNAATTYSDMISILMRVLPVKE